MLAAITAEQIIAPIIDSPNNRFMTFAQKHA
jgi:hypothetical protein